MKKVLFLGTKPIGFLCLKHLLEQEKEQCEVVAVLTKENKAFASQHDWTTLCKSRNIKMLGSLDDILSYSDIDFVISVQYHQIIKQKHIDIAKELAINLHMAPLPEYRGANQFSYAIINGDSEFGTTLHVIDAGIDSGDMIAERRFDMPKGAFISDLYDKTFAESIVLFQTEIGAILRGDYSLVPQDSLIAERGTSLHFKKEIADLKKIDLDWPAEKIENHIRATSMPGYPPPYFMLGDKIIEFTIQES